MSDDDISRRITAERLRLFATMCQTLAVGVLLVGIVAPLLDADGAEAGLSGLEIAAVGVFALVLVFTAYKLTGDAIRSEP